MTRGIQFPLTLTASNAVMLTLVPGNATEFHVGPFGAATQVRGMVACEQFFAFPSTVERMTGERFVAKHPREHICPSCQWKVRSRLIEAFGEKIDRTINRIRVQFYQEIASENPSLNLQNVSVTVHTDGTNLHLQPWFGGHGGEPVEWRVDYNWTQGDAIDNFIAEAMLDYRKSGLI